MYYSQAASVEPTCKKISGRTAFIAPVKMLTGGEKKGGCALEYVMGALLYDNVTMLLTYRV